MNAAVAGCGERVGIGLTYFSQHFGASSTSRSMVISPSDVSRSTDMAQRRLCGAKVFVAKIPERDEALDVRWRPG